MTSKTTNRFGAKADFIRSQPESMSAKEVVEAAARHGIQISVNHVYNLRTATAKTGKPPATDVDTGAPKRGRGRPRADTAGTNVERQLRVGIAEVGLRRARELFEEIAGVFRLCDGMRGESN